MDIGDWKLDGPLGEGFKDLDELLKDMTMIITDEQRELVQEFVPNAQWYIDEVEVDKLLDALNAKIEEVGVDTNGQLNEFGQKLKKLCEELDEQN